MRLGCAQGCGRWGDTQHNFAAAKARNPFEPPLPPGVSSARTCDRGLLLPGEPLSSAPRSAGMGSSASTLNGWQGGLMGGCATVCTCRARGCVCVGGRGGETQIVLR